MGSILGGNLKIGPWDAQVKISIKWFDKTTMGVGPGVEAGKRSQGRFSQGLTDC